MPIAPPRAAEVEIPASLLGAYRNADPAKLEQLQVQIRGRIVAGESRETVVGYGIGEGFAADFVGWLYDQVASHKSTVAIVQFKTHRGGSKTTAWVVLAICIGLILGQASGAFRGNLDENVQLRAAFNIVGTLFVLFGGVWSIRRLAKK